MEPGALASLRTHIMLFMQSVILCTFLDMLLFGTLFPYDLISVELPFATSELKEEQYCYRVFGCDPASASLLE